MIGTMRTAVVLGAVIVAGIIAIFILVVLLSSSDAEEEAGDLAEVEATDADVPVELRQLMVLTRIDRKLRAVHLVAILALIGWLLTCLALAIGLALGPTVLISDLLRRLLR